MFTNCCTKNYQIWRWSLKFCPKSGWKWMEWPKTNAQSGCTGYTLNQNRSFRGTNVYLRSQTEHFFCIFCKSSFTHVPEWGIFVFIKKFYEQPFPCKLVLGALDGPILVQCIPCTARLKCTPNRPKLGYRGVSHHFGNPRGKSFSLYKIKKF